MRAARRFWGGLLSKYAASFVGLAVFVLAVNLALEMWFTYHDTMEAVGKLESDKAEAAAQRIDRAITELERQIGWVTRASATLEQRRSDYALLLQQVPAVEELMQLDGAGRELLKVSRYSTEAIAGTDFSQDPKFTQALAKRVWFGPIYFQQSGPYMTIAMAHAGAYAGVTVAEIDLGFLRDFVSGIQVGKSGYAYVVGPQGRVLVHSDQTRIPGGSDLSGLPQVAAALATSVEIGARSGFGRDRRGRSVLMASAALPRIAGAVMIEQPVTEALKPLSDLVIRMAWLLALCLVVAVFAGVLLARRMVVPIRAVQQGASRVGAGEFEHRIEVRTGDEVEVLANEFNSMAAQLHESYSRLEQTVEERTRDLAQTVRELKALEEIGRTVASSLDLRSVLATIVTRAVELAQAEAGAIFHYDKSQRVFRLAEAHGLDPALVDAIRAVRVPLSSSVMGEAALARKPILIADLAETARYPLRDLVLSAGFRSVLVLPLVGPDEILGALIVQRTAVGEFAGGTVTLMQTFADQSVIAMHNAELFREVEERGRQLQIANEHKSQFFANMSHELRTPLNAVLGYAELLLDGLYGQIPDKAVGILERVQANGKHLLGLINDVLDLSKIEAGQLNLSFTEYSMRSVVESVVAATESLAKAKGLALTTSIAPDLPIGRGDERRLTQVLLNIVGNAIKFTETGSVEIRARAADGVFDVAVRDTGPGIAPQDQARIFDEFQQVDSSNTRQKGGTGLGLSISRHLTEMHGGTISLKSELGVGSVFSIVVPVQADEQRGAA
jgi:signal transduction histidine kinase